jgi:parallel beta-helix repeat protein
MRRGMMITLLLVAATSPALRADEGRIPIFRPTRITQPGHYVVTRNIAVTAGILLDIQAGGVTVDLNGHTLSSSSTTDDLVQFTCPGAQDPPVPDRILNGNLVGGLNTIHAIPPGPCKLSFENLQIGDPSIRAILVEETGQVEMHGIIVNDRPSPSVGPMIDLRATSTGPRGSAVISNIRLYDGPDTKGIWLSHVVGHLFAGVIDIDGSGSPGPAINLADASGSSIRDVVINWSQEGGDPSINLVYSSGVLIAGNILRCDGSVRTATTHHGIFADALSHDTEIINNSITGAGGDGIHLESRGNNLFGNLVNSNGGNGVFVAGDNNLVDGNKVGGNLLDGLFFNTAGNPPHVFRHNVLRGNLAGVGGPFGTAVTDAGGNVQ